MNEKPRPLRIHRQVARPMPTAAHTLARKLDDTTFLIMIGFVDK